MFELLGMRVVDNGGDWMFALVDPSVGDASNNACYASQVTPEQWTLEQCLASVMARSDSAVGTAAQAYVDRVDPNEPGAYAPGTFQAFVPTDVVAGGLLALSQLIELQWHLPRAASRLG